MYPLRSFLNAATGRRSRGQACDRRRAGPRISAWWRLPSLVAARCAVSPRRSGPFQPQVQNAAWMSGAPNLIRRSRTVMACSTTVPCSIWRGLLICPTDGDPAGSGASWVGGVLLSVSACRLAPSARPPRCRARRGCLAVASGQTRGSRSRSPRRAGRPRGAFRVRLWCDAPR